MPHLVVAGIGAHARLELSGPQADKLHQRLSTIWSRCLDRHRPTTSIRIETTADDDVDHLLPGITQRVTRALIASQTGRVLLLHAGAVCHPATGRSLVFVAEGGGGKTTLARGLAGEFGYLTDETVAIDADQRVLPYPKPLSIRPLPRPGAKVEHSPDELELAHPPAEATVARLVLLDRTASHGDEPTMTELPLLDAIAAIAPQSSALYALPRGLHRCATLIEATGPVLRFRYAEAESLHALAADLIGAPR